MGLVQVRGLRSAPTDSWEGFPSRLRRVGCWSAGSWTTSFFLGAFLAMARARAFNLQVVSKSLDRYWWSCDSTGVISKEGRWVQTGVVVLYSLMLGEVCRGLIGWIARAGCLRHGLGDFW